MNTTVYLIRHSIRFDAKRIDSYYTSQSELLKNEKCILSIEGEKRAKILANDPELKDIDLVYVSNCVRTLQTAKYLLDNQKLNVNIDERFDERRVGIPNDSEYPNWFELQYTDENYKTVGGESQKEVRERFSEAFNEVVSKNKGKRIVIFSHGYAITFFLMKWIKFEHVTKEKRFTFSYNDKIFFDKVIDAPEVFRVLINDKNEVINIENINIDYNVGIDI